MKFEVELDVHVHGFLISQCFVAEYLVARGLTLWPRINGGLLPYQSYRTVARAIAPEININNVGSRTGWRA